MKAAIRRAFEGAGLRPALTGDIIAYFAGSSAGNRSELGMLVNGVSTGVLGIKRCGEAK